MTFDQIQSFFLVATLGTYRKAAEKLNATQPTISARIVALEERLGVRLFDRSGHRVALTPQGRLFLNYAEKLLEIRAEALGAVGGADDLTGIVRIGASDTMAITWIPDFLSELRLKYPNAVIELHVAVSYRLREDLLARQIDIAFMVGPVAQAEIISHPFCVCPMVLTAAPGLGLHGRKLTREEIARLDIFTFERRTRPYQELRQHLNETIPSMVRLSPVNSLQTIVLLVEKGLGAGAVPLAAIENELASGSLVPLQAEIELPEIRHGISYLMGPDMSVAETISEQARDFLKNRYHGKSIEIIY